MQKNPTIVWATLLLAACVTGAGSSEPEEEPVPMKLGEPVRLEVGETAQMTEPELMTVRFLDVPSDSRCPKGVTCVWAGDAEAVFEVWMGPREGGEPVEVGLHTHGGAQYPQVRAVAGYVLRLKDLDPYPVEGQPIDPEGYEATLEVTEGSGAPAGGAPPL